MTASEMRSWLDAIHEDAISTTDYNSANVAIMLRWLATFDEVDEAIRMKGLRFLIKHLETHNDAVLFVEGPDAAPESYVFFTRGENQIDVQEVGVDPRHQGRNLGFLMYLVLLKRYGTVYSGEKQTEWGTRLWKKIAASNIGAVYLENWQTLERTPVTVGPDGEFNPPFEYGQPNVFVWVKKKPTP